MNVKLKAKLQPLFSFHHFYVPSFSHFPLIFGPCYIFKQKCHDHIVDTKSWRCASKARELEDLQPTVVRVPVDIEVSTKYYSLLNDEFLIDN